METHSLFHHSRIRLILGVTWGLLVIFGGINSTFLSRLGYFIRIPDGIWVARYGQVMYNRAPEHYDTILLSDSASPEQFKKLSEVISTHSWGYHESRTALNAELYPDWVWYRCQIEFEKRGHRSFKVKVVRVFPLQPERNRTLEIPILESTTREEFLRELEAPFP